jgi:hypothetical protein
MENKIEICKYIQNNVEKLSDIEINQIFKILYESKSCYSQNNHGIFCNLSWLDESILQQIYDYIQFCLKSHNEISHYELMKSLITDSMTPREKPDDKTLEKSNTTNVQVNAPVKTTKISSSMKFYLLKKRFLKKTNTIQSNILNDLVHEEYAITS